MASQATSFDENDNAQQRESGNESDLPVFSSQNRFSPLLPDDPGNNGANGGRSDDELFEGDSKWERFEGRKRKKISSSGTSTCDINSFKAMGTDEKLLVLFTKLNEHSVSTAKVEQKLDHCLHLQERVIQVESQMDSFDRRLLYLEYKSLDLEARGRRNNLLFMGFPEEPAENCTTKIKSFLSDSLHIDFEVVIDRAHRLGKFRRGSQRAIIVAFRDYSSVESVLVNAHLLKNTSYSVNKDFPKEIAQARKALWGQFKDLKRAHPNSRISLSYPAKIIKDGKVVADKFPQWDKILSDSRVDTIPLVPPPRAQQHSVARAPQCSGVSPQQTVPVTDGSLTRTHDVSRRQSGTSGQPQQRVSRSPRRRSYRSVARLRTEERSSSAPRQTRTPAGSSETNIRRPWDDDQSSQNTPAYTNTHPTNR